MPSIQGEPHRNCWGSWHLPLPWKTQGRQSWRQKGQAGTCPLPRRIAHRTIPWWDVSSKAENHLLGSLGTCLQADQMGKASREECRSYFRKGYACVRLSWWKQEVRHLRMGKEEMRGPKNAPNNGSLIRHHVLGHAEHEETLLRGHSSRVQQAWAIWIWVLVNYTKGGLGWHFRNNQSMQRGLKAGREAASRDSGAEGLPYPRPCREIPPRWQKCLPALLPCSWHCPRIAVTKCFQRSVESLVQLYLIRWWERTKQWCNPAYNAENQSLPISACLGRDFAEVPSRQDNLLRGGSPIFHFRAQPVAHFNHREHFQAEGGPGAVHNFTGCFFQSKINFKAQHGFWCSYLASAKQAEDDTFVLSWWRSVRQASRSWETDRFKAGSPSHGWLQISACQRLFKTPFGALKP